MASVKEVKSGKSQKYTALKTVSRYDDQTTKKTRKSKEHDEWHYNELPWELHGTDYTDQQPGSSRNKGRAA